MMFILCKHIQLHVSYSPNLMFKKTSLFELNKMQNSKEHIRHCLLYEYQLGHNATEATINICRAIGPGVVSIATAHRWFKCFRNNDYSLQDQPKSGRPTEIDLSEINRVIESDPSLTTRGVASKLGCSHGTIQYAFKQLRLVSKLGEWVPHDLSQKQKKITLIFVNNCSHSNAPSNGSTISLLGMRSGSSILTPRGSANGLNLIREQSPCLNLVCTPKKGCFVFGGIY